VLFSVHMSEHMVLSMLVPIFLVLGAPVTLALRALKPAKRRGDRGPREWITVILHSRAAKFIAHPAIATAIFIVSTYALYFTPLFASAMQEHLGHIAMTLHFLLSGCRSSGSSSAWTRRRTTSPTWAACCCSSSPCRSTRSSRSR
jgi:putative copper resistance protein D